MVKIFEVGIGLENGEWKENYYIDTEERVKDGDTAYKIETTDVAGVSESIYFRNKENAIKYVEETMVEDYIIE